MKKKQILLIDYYNLEPTTKWPDLVLLHTLSVCGECPKHDFIQQHVNVRQKVFDAPSVTFNAVRHTVNSLIQKGYIIQDGDFISVNKNLFRFNETSICNRSNYLLTVFLDVRDLMLLDYIVHWYYKATRFGYYAILQDDFVRISPNKFEQHFQITYRQIQHRLNKLVELKFLNKKIISGKSFQQFTVYQPVLQYQAWVDLKKKRVLISTKDKITCEIHGKRGLKLLKHMSPEEQSSYVEGCGFIQEDLITKMCLAYAKTHVEDKLTQDEVIL